MGISSATLALVRPLVSAHGRSRRIGKSLGAEHRLAHRSDYLGRRTRLCNGHVSLDASLPARHVRPPPTLSAGTKNDARFTTGKLVLKTKEMLCAYVGFLGCSARRSGGCNRGAQSTRTLDPRGRL